MINVKHAPQVTTARKDQVHRLCALRTPIVQLIVDSKLIVVLEPSEVLLVDLHKVIVLNVTKVQCVQEEQTQYNVQLDFTWTYKTHKPLVR